MLALWIILGIIALFALLLALPLKIALDYTPEEGLQYRLKYWLIPLMDSRKEPAEEKAPKSVSPKKEKGSGNAAKALLSFLGLKDISSASNAKKALDEKGLIAMLEGVLSAVKELLRRCGKLVKSGVFRRFDLRIVVGKDDPADAAQAYGAVCAAAYPLLTLLQSWMKFRSPQVDIHCDFSSEQTLAEFHGLLAYRPLHFLGFLGGLLVQNIKRSFRKEGTSK